MDGTITDRDRTIDTPAHAILIALFIDVELFKFPLGKNKETESCIWGILPKGKQLHSKVGRCIAYQIRSEK